MNEALEQLKEEKENAFARYQFWMQKCQDATTEEALARAGREMRLAHIEYLQRETLLLQVLKQHLYEQRNTP